MQDIFKDQDCDARMNSPSQAHVQRKARSVEAREEGMEWQGSNDTNRRYHRRRKRTGHPRGDTNFPLRVKGTSEMGQWKKCPSKGDQALSLRISYAILVRSLLDTYPLEGYTLP